MQGQRSAMGSMPETLGFDHGSTSSGAGIDQQIYWNNVRNSGHNMLPGYAAPASELSSSYLNSTSQEGPNLSGWNVGEPSSSGGWNFDEPNSCGTQNAICLDEQKAEHGWSFTVDCSGAGPMSEERQYEQANVLSLNNADGNPIGSQISNAPLFVQSSSDAIPEDLDMNAEFVGYGSGDYQITDSSTNVPENTRMPSASSSSSPFVLPYGSDGYFIEENDGTPGCSLEGRRFSCKRKALDGNTGQSSIGGSSSYFQQAESNVWHAVPGWYNAASSVSISTPPENVLHVNPPEQVTSRLGLGSGGATQSSLMLNVAGNAESSHRNYRSRINPSLLQDCVPVTGSTASDSNVSSQQQSSSLLALNNSSEMRSSTAPDNTNSRRQSTVVRVPALRRTQQSSRWNGGSISRPGRSSSSGERNTMPLEESESVTMPRNIADHPMFVPANERMYSSRNSTNRSSTGGNTNIAANVASSSRTSSTSVVPPWIAPRNTSQYARRLSELARRSLSSSAGSESRGHSSSSSPVPSGPSSQEMTPSSGAGNQGHLISHSRSAMLLERHLDGSVGSPYSLRTLAAGGEGRSRLVSEIRNVLDLMRRGEGLRLEDVMILDQSVFFGMTDIHDRHRDMRLDVDNMSYEELLALEERIGNVSTGLSEETIMDLLKQRKYFSIAMGVQLELEPCCVCQEEYRDGEDIGTLECGHEFHTACIKQWLMQKNLCPICKTTTTSK